MIRILAQLFTTQTILTLAFTTSSVFASALPFREALQIMHADVPANCALVEKPERNSGNPYIQPSKCEIGQFDHKRVLHGTVYRVVDGDTIHFLTNEGTLYGIRMLGIDTPELHFFGKAQPQWGARAQGILNSLVQEGDAIKLELDKTKCDKYGRILAHVFKGKMNLNAEMVKRGAAVNYCILPNVKYCKEYAQFVREAQQQSGNIYDDSCMIVPYIWRKAIEGKVIERKLKNIQTDEVFDAKEYYKVPLADRVFF